MHSFLVAVLIPITDFFLYGQIAENPFGPHGGSISELTGIIPAMFMSAVTTTYFFIAPECLGGLWSRIGMDDGVCYLIAVAPGMIVAILFFGLFSKKGKKQA